MGNDVEYNIRAARLRFALYDLLDKSKLSNDEKILALQNFFCEYCHACGLSVEQTIKIMDILPSLKIIYEPKLNWLNEREKRLNKDGLQEPISSS